MTLPSARSSLLPPGMDFIERGWLSANHLAIDDPEGTILVDTGHQRDEAATVEILRLRGHPPETLRRLVVTHVHPDHWGGNRRLVELSGAAIACGPETAEAFAHYDRRAMWIDYFDSEVYHDPAVEPLPADEIWEIGDRVRLGAFHFAVLAAPGHAPDSIALWQPEYRILISADALHDGDCGILNVAVHGEGVIRDALETARRFRSLGAEIVIPGHGPLILDPENALDRLEARLRAFRDDPRKLARHVAGRVLMSSLLVVQPIALEDLCELFRGSRWLADYGSMLEIDDRTDLVRLLVSEFRQRGLVKEEDGLLRSAVRR